VEGRQNPDDRMPATSMTKALLTSSKTKIANTIRPLSYPDNSLGNVPKDPFRFIRSVTCFDDTGSVSFSYHTKVDGEYSREKFRESHFLPCSPAGHDQQSALFKRMAFLSHQRLRAQDAANHDQPAVDKSKKAMPLQAMVQSRAPTGRPWPPPAAKKNYRVTAHPNNPPFHSPRS
jgi:hypothetical protein